MKLRLLVEHDPETCRWSAVFPELPGCASAGDTEEEAIANAKKSIAPVVRAHACQNAQGRKTHGTRRAVSRRFPVRHAKEVIKVLRKHGFPLVVQSGSHQKWRHTNGRQVIVAMHGSKPIPIGTLKSIIEGSGLDVEDFR